MMAVSSAGERDDRLTRVERGSSTSLSHESWLGGRIVGRGMDAAGEVEEEAAGGDRGGTTAGRNPVGVYTALLVPPPLALAFLPAALRGLVAAAESRADDEGALARACWAATAAA